MKPDLLQQFFYKYKPQKDTIKKLILGERQLIVQLKNNNIGTCTTLGNKLFALIENVEEPDFENISHRALLIAYYNAQFNNTIKPDSFNDISEIIDFNNYAYIVMIGFFRSLAEKIDRMKIPLNVFDLDSDDTRLSEMNEMPVSINKAYAIIITATTFLNQTFENIIKNARNNCDVFILGPSSIMHPFFFNFPKIKYIFGSSFSDTEKVIQIAENGGGIKDMINFMQKKYIRNHNNNY